MSSFDPVAATAAYLAQLPPSAHAKAQAYTQGGHWLILWGALVSIAAAWIILRLGVARRAAASVQRRRPRPWSAAFLAAAAFFAVSWVIELPWAAYSGWWRETQYGLTSQPFAGWLTERLIGGVMGVIVAGLLIMLIYFLIRRAPRLWPVLTGVVVSAFGLFMLFLQPVVIEPIFNKYEPAPPGAVRDLVVAMGRQAGVPTDKILVYNGSKQSNRYTANVSGFLGTSRIAMSDVMFKKDADLAEVRGVVGHEMGHYKRGHLFEMIAFFGFGTMIMGFIVQALFPVAARILGGWGVTGIADPAGLPILMILVTVLGVLGTPAINTMVRFAETDADRYSLENFNEPDGLARALVKTIDYRAATPGAVEEFLFYDHPSVSARVRMAMDWKAAHLGELPRP